MQLRIGYFPVLDAALVLRQACEGFRFAPFNPLMEGIAARLSAGEAANIESVGEATRNWLGVIEALMDRSSAGCLGVEEALPRLLREPARALPRLSDGEGGGPVKDSIGMEAARLLAGVLDRDIAPAAARNSRGLRSAVEALDRDIALEGPWPFFLNLTDRLHRVGPGVIGFRIKPDFEVREAEVENIIILPSLVASRRLTFWHRGQDLVFWIAAEAKPLEDEPSDNLLISTLALADRTRLKMLRRLAAGPCGNNEMAAALGVNPSTASRHFKLFKDAGFVEPRGEGNRTDYELSREALKAAVASVLTYIEGGKR
jgi:DNA-binding transcriptional ArsR family regulator